MGEKPLEAIHMYLPVCVLFTLCRIKALPSTRETIGGKKEGLLWTRNFPKFFCPPEKSSEFSLGKSSADTIKRVIIYDVIKKGGDKEGGFKGSRSKSISLCLEMFLV